MKGYFITFEGVDNAGKTTHVQSFCDYLTSNDFNVVRYREPGGTDFGESIRKTLLDKCKRDPVSDLLLFNAARFEGTSQIILPALSRGDIVVADRYYDSTMAYQGYGSGIEIDRVKDVIRIATGGLVPDLTFLIDADPRSLKREGKDNFEARGAEYHDRVYRGFLQIAEDNPERVVKIPYLKDELEKMQCMIRNIADVRIARCMSQCH